MHLYQTTLARLIDYELNADTLAQITPFLASAFKRMPPPALGPVAFKDFWDVVRSRLTLSSSTFPETFKQALRINRDFFGGHLPSQPQAQPLQITHLELFYFLFQAIQDFPRTI